MTMAMIETINLTKKYGELTALNNLNLTIEQGDCFGFIGPNGAGKTTTIKILATLLKPTWGEARIDGRVSDTRTETSDPASATSRTSWVRVRRHGRRGVPRVLRLGVQHQRQAAQAGGRGRPGADRPRLQARRGGERLSRGMQQRLSVARVLLHDPKVLLMDEPASGLDPRARVEIRELLKELRRMGKTILISSHILHELAELCNVVGIIEQGELIFSGPVEEVMSRARVGKVIHITVESRAEEAGEMLRQVPGINKVIVTQEDRGPVLHCTIDEESGMVISDIPSRLITNGFRLTSMEEEKINLETAFMRLTRGLVQ
jgi:ABC-2 type transport system ATP-binding protein